MPHDRLEKLLESTLRKMQKDNSLKGRENVICGVLPPKNGKGPRFFLEGYQDKPFLRMNSNSYLGLAFRAEVISAEEDAAQVFGTGPGAVRFISGTWSPHKKLEQRLASFSGRQAAITFSSAYAAVMGCLPPLVSDKTAVISDALNHNCIINAIRLANPINKKIYRHLDMTELEIHLDTARQTCNRAIIVTDGIFSMRGDHAPLDQIMDLAKKYDSVYSENVIVIVDDSHGVGAFGETGRGVEEYTRSGPADILIATLGKAFGVNGGYATTSLEIINYLRETSPFYIYSNPITPAEAAAALKAVDILDGEQGRGLLDHLRLMTRKFELGLMSQGFETIPGEHPVVPLMVRDTTKTSKLVRHLFENDILATGLNFPVVPKGQEEIRFQISADHTEADINEVLSVLNRFSQ